MTDPTKSETPVKDTRIPNSLYRHPIMVDFCRQYLSVIDEIASYNEKVLAVNESGWNTPKIMEKARELGRPTDADVKPNMDIQNAITVWEEAVNAMNLAKRAVVEVTSKELGIETVVTVERSPELEAPLRERHKFGFDLGKNLKTMADMLTDDKISGPVVEFLANNQLPTVGRNQAKSFSDDAKSTPKYRVTVTVFNKDGEKVLDETAGAGFTKAAQALTKPVFNYERGKAPNAADLRAAWEKAGNTGENTLVNPVEFDDNDLHYVITKK